jgi:hypothetical protein
VDAVDAAHSPDAVDAVDAVEVTAAPVPEQQLSIKDYALP